MPLPKKDGWLRDVAKACDNNPRRMGSLLSSVRDVASHGDTPFVLKRLQAAGEIAGPRIFTAGQLITQTGGHAAIHAFGPTFPEVPNGNPNSMTSIASGPDQWREAVRIQFTKGADLNLPANIIRPRSPRPSMRRIRSACR